LEVFNFNEKALRWYQKEGFVEFGKTNWYIMTLKNNKMRSNDVQITNEKDAKKQFDKYGFCMLNLLSKQEFQVGLLGDKWIRIVSKDILNDIDALLFYFIKNFISVIYIPGT